jgi:hypothetical protein
MEAVEKQSWLGAKTLKRTNSNPGFIPEKKWPRMFTWKQSSILFLNTNASMAASLLWGKG